MIETLHIVMNIGIGPIGKIDSKTAILTTLRKVEGSFLPSYTFIKIKFIGFRLSFDLKAKR